MSIAIIDIITIHTPRAPYTISTFYVNASLRPLNHIVNCTHVLFKHYATFGLNNTARYHEINTRDFLQR